jgi:FkbM family methyltransferase
MTPLCQKRSKYFPNIRFTEAAIGLSETPVTFYKIDQEKTKSQDGLPYYIQKDGNPGASSLFKSLDTVYKQVPVEVQSLRLDTYVQKNNIYQIDVLWMDIQGSELNALKSLGDHLHNVKMIHTEMPVGPNTEYDGAPTFEEIDGYLRDFGFKMVGKGQMDMIYHK